MQTPGEWFMNEFKLEGQRRIAPAAALAAAVVSALTCSAARAAERDDGPLLGEIVVTAQKREQNLKDVPISVAVLDERFLVERGLTDLRSYASFTPGLVYAHTSLAGERSGPDIAIRGVSNSRVADFETSVATATTGFVYGDLPVYAFDPDTIDVARIEVLKGPQGTLYGASSMGGTLKVVPNDPKLDRFEASVRAGGSMTDQGGDNYVLSGMVNLPLVADTVAVRLNGFHRSNSGYIDARLVKGYPNEPRGSISAITAFNPSDLQIYGGPSTSRDINDESVTGGRVAIRFAPSERFDATLAIFSQSKDEGSLSNLEPAISTGRSKRVTELYILQPTTVDYHIASLEASYDFGAARLFSTTGWLQRDFSNITDFTAITYGVLGGNGQVPVPGTSPLAVTTAARILSQELRLQSERMPLGIGSAAVEWVLGYFYQRESRRSTGSAGIDQAWVANSQAPLTPIRNGTPLLWAADYRSTYDNNSVFADVTLHLTDRLAISAGARYASQKLDSTRIDFGDYFAGATTPTGTTLDARRIDENKTTPRAAVTFAATDDVSLYASYSKGFRIGGGNPVQNLRTPQCQAALAALGSTATGNFKSDNIDNLEAGIKGSVASGRVRGALSAYNIDWSDLQLSVNLLNYNAGCGASVVANVGKARIRGVDIDVRALLTDWWQIAFAGQYAKAEIVDAAPGTAAKNGDPLKDIPKYTASLGSEWSFDMPFGSSGKARIDYVYQGERNAGGVGTGVDPAFVLPSYGLLNLRGIVDKDNWTFTAFVDNLTDRRPELGVYIFPGGPGDFRGAYQPAGLQRFVGTSRARTYGLEVSKRF